MTQDRYLNSPSPFGKFAIIWRELEGIPRIIRVFLPGKHPQLELAIREEYPRAEVGNQSEMRIVAGKIQSYLAGEEGDFDLKWLDWDQCTAFQARVLRAEYEIPRGWVSTYGRIARKLEVPGGSRAVGSALASNPFPILIPCHRAVRSTGELGGYQGGLAMKKALLEIDGVFFSSPTRVSMEQVYY
jgi:methylated-DNA-[protein]-cysteine S-methyltransferase